MKHKITIFILFGILTFGCNQPTGNNDKEKKKEQLKQDSITAVKTEKERIKKVRRDSIISIEQDKVIGDIMFGMTKKEVKSKIEKFIKENRRPHKVLGEPYYEYYIGEFKYFQILDFYYEGKFNYSPSLDNFNSKLS